MTEVTRAQQAIRVRKLFEINRKRKELEKTEDELKMLLKKDLGSGVHRYGSYQLTVVETEKQIVDLEALTAHLGAGELNKFRKPSVSISATVIRVTDSNG